MKPMKRFLFLCITAMALGLTTKGHADSILVSGNGQMVGTQVAGMTVTDFGLPVGSVQPYVVPGWPSYKTIPGTQWVSPLYDPKKSLFALSATPGQDYTFTQSFTTSLLGIFQIKGSLVSDNNLVFAYLDNQGNPLAGVPVSLPDSRADENGYNSYRIELPFGPTAGAAGAHHTLVFIVHNQTNNFDYDPMALDFQASVIQPVVHCEVAKGELWPPNHDLVNVGLGLTVPVSGGTGTSTVTVTVLSNEADQPSGAKGGDHFSPDASSQGLDTLRLRAERLGTGSGRVYLIIVMAKDTAGNTGYCTSTVVVPHDQSAASIAAVTLAATNAAALYEAGNPLAGYVVVGGPGAPVDGPKQ